jgi:hypothetical protein
MRTIQDYHTPMIGRGHDLSKQRMDARNRIHQAQPRRSVIWFCHQGVSFPPGAARNANLG